MRTHHRIAAAWLALVAVRLVAGCDDPKPLISPPAKPSYDRFHDALEESTALTLACIASVRDAFDRPTFAGLTVDSLPPSRPPEDHSALKTAIVFEVPIDTDGRVANCDPSSMIPIHELQDAAVSAHVDRDTFCGIRDRMTALGMWPDRAEEGIAMLRAPKSPPPLVLYYARWCDHDLSFRGAFTCSVSLTWMRMPSKQIVARATGVGKAKPTDRPYPYVAAMDRAEQQAATVVRAW